MRQLVGLNCTRCEKTIPSIIEGQFCPDCGCPVHNRCAQPDTARLDGCPVCGSSVAAAKSNQQQEKTEAMTVEMDLRVNRGIRHISIGVACVVASVLAALFLGILGLGLFLVGLAEIFHGLIVVMRKGPPEY
jgi:hypothetical protein